MAMLAVAAVARAQEDASPPRHEAFARSAVVAAEYGLDGTVVLVDGKTVPERFSLDPCAGVLRGEPIAEVAGPIEFVLVMSGETTIDRVEFRADRPFYLAAAPLDQAQFAANMLGLGEGYIDYESLRDSEKQLARLNRRHSGEIMEFLDGYLADPALPVVRQDVASASKALVTLSGTSGLRTRLPTLGEWYVAVRGPVGKGEAQDDPFWNGDEPPWDEIVWAGDYEQGATRLQGAQRIRPAATAPTSHPLGLREMIGSVADLVFPSEAERAAVAERLLLTERKDAHHVVQAHTAVRLGGGIDGTWDITIDAVPDGLDSLEALDRATFTNSLVNLEGIFYEGYVTANAGWLYHDRWATGLRPVIELPAGEVTVREVADFGP